MTTPTAEQREIRSLARDFAEGEIRPRAPEWDAARELDDSIFEKLSELGFMGMLIPGEHGGLGLDVPTYLLALEALAWGDAAVALSVAIQNGPVADVILRNGSDAQKEAWLPRIASGELLVAFALSEPGAGSDAAALETAAERTDGGWRISGRKKWVTNGARAGAALVFARTVPDAPGGGDVGAFFVETDSDGYRPGARETTMGLRASETVEVELDGVRVPAEGVVGDPGAGYRYALRALDVGRVGIAAQAVGIAQAAYEHARGYAVDREQFGRPIADFEAIRFKVAEMATRIAGARALTLEAGRSVPFGAGGAGDDPSPVLDGAGGRAGAAMAKLAASETAMWVTTEAVQIYGGYGYMRDYPVEKLMRDAKGTEIYEGTSEIQRLVIADGVLDRGDDAG